MIKARLSIAVRNRQTANSLMKSVEPDNLVPDLRIRGRPGTSSLGLDINFSGGVETFISTLDDLLRCLQAAMETLDNIKTERE